jgi:hypothetical protein
MVDDPAQNTLEDIMTHLGLSLHRSAPHGMVAIVCRRHRLLLAADANHVAGKRRHAHMVLHGGAELRTLQLQSWDHGQGRKPCSRCHAGAAAEAREGLLAGHCGRIDGFQKCVKAGLRHVSAKGALRPCDDGHVGRICDALLRLPARLQHRA